VSKVPVPASVHAQVKSSNAEQLTICEVNTGIMALDSGLLKTYLGNLDANNAQGELYWHNLLNCMTRAQLFALLYPAD
jgi:bifunctional N-acetylglucosamine-1-phosphate-uridyltransferase/glucosamine-1-phosphate-acetyltransferase GlmU-like protein